MTVSSGTLTLNDELSVGGTLTLISNGTTQNANITAGSGTITTGTGPFTMASGTGFTTTSGDIIITSGTDASLEDLTGAANLSVISGGILTTMGAANITGSTTVEAVAATMDTASSLSTASLEGTFTNDTVLDLLTTTGNTTVTVSSGTLTLNEELSVGGTLTLISNGTTQNANITAGSGTITAGTGPFTMASGTGFTTTSGDIIITSGTDASLEDLTGAANLSVTSGGILTTMGAANITGATTVEAVAATMDTASSLSAASLEATFNDDTVLDRLTTTGDTTVIVSAGTLTLNDIVSAGDALAITAEGCTQNANISAASGVITAGSGPFTMATDTSLTATSGDIIITSGSDASLEDLTGAANLSVTSGGILTTMGATNITGATTVEAVAATMDTASSLSAASFEGTFTNDTVLDRLTTTGDTTVTVSSGTLTLNDELSVGGTLTLISNGTTQNANITAGSGTITAGTGPFTMVSGTDFTTTSGDIIITSDTDVSLEDLTGAANLSVTSGGILTTIGAVNITGATTVEAVAATMNGVSSMDAASFTGTFTSNTILDRLTTAGITTVTVSTGTLTLNDIVSAGDALTITAEGCTQNANISAASGVITAGSGPFTMATDTSLTATSGDIVITSDANVSLEDLTGAGNLSVTSGGILTTMGAANITGATTVEAVAATMDTASSLSAASLEATFTNDTVLNRLTTTADTIVTVSSGTLTLNDELSVGGALTIISNGTTQNANITAGSGTITAGTGPFTMASGTGFTTTFGDIIITSDTDVLLEDLTGAANLSVTSGGILTTMGTANITGTTIVEAVAATMDGVSSLDAASFAGTFTSDTILDRITTAGITTVTVSTGTLTLNDIISADDALAITAEGCTQNANISAASGVITAGSGPFTMATDTSITATSGDIVITSDADVSLEDVTGAANLIVTSGGMLTTMGAADITGATTIEAAAATMDTASSLIAASFEGTFTNDTVLDRLTTTGDTTVTVASGTLILNDELSVDGALTLISNGTTQNANITAGSGTITAGTGPFTMATDTSITATSGDIVITSDADVSLEDLTGAANLSVTSGGILTTMGAANITGATTVEAVAAIMDTTSSLSAASLEATFTNNTVLDRLTTTGATTVTVSYGTLTLNDELSVGGALTLISNGMTQNANITAGTGTITAGTGPFTMSSGTGFTTTFGDIIITSDTDVSLEDLTGATKLSVTSGGILTTMGAANITGATTVEAVAATMDTASSLSAASIEATFTNDTVLDRLTTTGDTTVTVSSGTLTLNDELVVDGTLTLISNGMTQNANITAGTGTITAGTGPFTMSSGTGFTTTFGDIIITSDTNVSLENLTGAANLSVTSGGMLTTMGAADITGATTAEAVAATMGGASSLDAASFEGTFTNDTILDRLTTAGITTVTVSSGTLTLNDIVSAGDALALTAEGCTQNADIRAASGVITAGSGPFNMATGTNLTATSGNIIITSDVDVSLEDITGAGTLTVTNGGALTNAGDITVAQTAALSSDTFSMVDGAALTSSGADIVITTTGNVLVSKLTAGGLIDVTSASGAILDNLSAETPNMTAASDITMTTATGVGKVSDNLNLSCGGKVGVDNRSGGIFIGSAADMTIGPDGLITQDGDILLDISGDLTLEGGIRTPGAVRISQTGSFTTNPGTFIEAGTEFETAVAGSYTMVDDFYITTNGMVNLTAGGTVYLTRVTGLDGINLISSGGSIADNSAAEADNLISNGLKYLRASTGIGAQGDGDIEVSGRVNAVTDTGGIYLQSADDMEIVNFNAASGDIMTVVAGELTVPATVTAMGGDVTMTAANIIQSGFIRANGSHDITLTTLAGDIAMTGSTNITGTGDITYTSARGITVALFSTGGAVNLTAHNGDIIDVFIDDTYNINADTLNLEASGSIGDEEGDGLDVDVKNISAISNNSGINMRILNGATVIEPGIWSFDENVFLYTENGLIYHDGIVNAATEKEAGAKIGVVGTGTVSIYENWADGASIDDDMIHYLAENQEQGDQPFEPLTDSGGTQDGLPAENPLDSNLFGEGQSLLNEFVEGNDRVAILQNIYQNSQPAQEGTGPGLRDRTLQSSADLPEAIREIARSLDGTFISPTVSHENREISRRLTESLLSGNGLNESLFGGNTSGDGMDGFDMSGSPFSAMDQGMEYSEALMNLFESGILPENNG
nr:hypothetical protein [uncultured Desulfobacter sp.]